MYTFVYRCSTVSSRSCQLTHTHAYNTHMHTTHTCTQHTHAHNTHAHAHNTHAHATHTHSHNTHTHTHTQHTHSHNTHTTHTHTFTQYTHAFTQHTHTHTDLSFSESTWLEVAPNCLLSLSTALRKRTTFSMRSCKTNPLVSPGLEVTFLLRDRNKGDRESRRVGGAEEGRGGKRRKEEEERRREEARLHSWRTTPTTNSSAPLLSRNSPSPHPLSHAIRNS